ncbi:MAG: hypothetical protein IJQ33_12460 [Clostridia bacterium]|nr:hypothetical protein [Clostridia bacterium]
MTLEEFKIKAQNSEELKAALKEAMEKGNAALAEFLKEQGVKLASRVQLSEDDLEEVVGGKGLNISKTLKKLLPNEVERQELKKIFDGGKDFVQKVINDTIFTH